MPTEDRKTCSKCGGEKPLDDFYKNDQCRDGHHTQCKTCLKTGMKARRDADLDEARRKDRERYWNNPQRRAGVQRRAKKRYLADIEESLAYRRAYYKANPSVYEKSRAKRKARKKNVEHQPYTRTEIYERDGGTCRGCGKHLPNTPGAFHIDHIVPFELDGPDIPSNVQLMCPRCNREKWANLEGQIHLPV